MELAKKIIDFVMDILETIVFVGSIFIVIYLYIAAPHQIKGASMDPTFHNGEYILTSKISYKFESIKRGDVVVFASLKNAYIDFIKRIIGLPGDQVKVADGEVSVNGIQLQENYISAKTTVFAGGFMQNDVEITVPEGEVFVMGDNRPRSSDSREFGPVPISNIIGKVIYRYFPPEKMGPIKNPLSFIPNSLRLVFIQNRN